MNLLLEKLRRFESLHIVFWLIKDSCWMLELKLTGTLMIAPTLGLAAYLIYKTYNLPDFFLNMAIFFWIAANSFWMLMEFFNEDKFKLISLIPFTLGILSIVIFYLKQTVRRKNDIAVRV